jgi:rhamnose utilization protein RhaD (predicted bifunctional aldolase and dehydrogenase)/NAD(P)-dependent dehydrogenase (short-subunit alcohol dehydrogenase family)
VVSRLTDADAAAVEALLAASREIGADPSLVLHGGGNCSVKVDRRGVDGTMERALLVKGSGHELGSLTEAGLTPLSLARVRGLSAEGGVTQHTLMDALLVCRLEACCPDPSVESIVHANIPHRFVLHSHADVTQALTDTKDAAARAAAAWGPRVAVLDYAMPGVPLGEAVRAEVAGWKDGAVPIAIVVIGHGVFAFGETAEEALNAHRSVVRAAEGGLRQAGVDLGSPASTRPRGEGIDPLERAERLSALRAELSQQAGMPLIVSRHSVSPAVAALDDPALADALRRGPVTPDHVTWAGPRPAIRETVAEFADWYHGYLARNGAPSDAAADVRLSFPRILLDDDFGLVTAGRAPAETRIAREIADHAVAVVQAAEALGGYQPPSEAHVFDLEQWAPQCAKFTRRDPASPDAGRIVLVTGAASGIGRACAEAYLDRGATVVGWDVSDPVRTMFDSERWLGQVVDVTHPDMQAGAIAEAVDRFGGIDVLVPAAGVFPAAMHLDVLDTAMWDRTMAINVSSVTTLFRLAVPFLTHAPGGGDVCVVASKNVAAPGPGAAAYSASKAALTQLARVAALEWAPKGIRVNIVHPDAVFDTGLWTPELLSARAEHYGMTIEEYKRRNLLRAEVTSRKVGDMVATITSGVFACTTGAQVPIDGGNARVI